MKTLITKPLSAKICVPDTHNTLQDALLDLLLKITGGELVELDAVPLVKLVVEKKPDLDIWSAAVDLVLLKPGLSSPSTPSAARILLRVKDTPIKYGLGSLAGGTYTVSDEKSALKAELESTLIMNDEKFLDTYFADLDTYGETAEAFFNKVCSGDQPLFNLLTGKWNGWEEPGEKSVQKCMERLVESLHNFLDAKEKHTAAGAKIPQRRYVAHPDIPVPGDVKRKPDMLLMQGDEPSWKYVLVPMEKKNLDSADDTESTSLAIAKYVRQVFHYQPARRFVLAVTLCRSKLRLWEFDRLGAVTSEAIIIHEKPELFVSILIALLDMGREQLGFDLGLDDFDNKRHVIIKGEDNATERLMIEKAVQKPWCIVGRATTCWVAHSEQDPEKMFVVKDSWQYVDRPHEGELLKIALAKHVTNISAYHYHEDVQYNGWPDTVLTNIRKIIIE